MAHIPFVRGIDLFFRNLKYLCRYNIKSIEAASNEERQKEQLHVISNMMDNLYWELGFMKAQAPKVLNMRDTIDALLKDDKLCLARFGDGEIYMMDNSIDGVFQDANNALVAELKEVASSQLPNLGIGLPYYAYNSLQNLNDHQRFYYRTCSAKLRSAIQLYLNDGSTYYDACLSMPYHLVVDIDYEEYFQHISKLWEGKDIVMICGKTVFDKIKYNCFDSARSIEYIYGPRTNAYDEIDSLMKQALQTDPCKTKFIILGHTATCLAYRLAKAGHRAIDIGHLAKDYNSWRMQEGMSANEFYKFYEKD